MAASTHATDNTEEVVFVITDSDEEAEKPGSRNVSETDFKSLFEEFVTCSNNLLTKIRDEATTEKIRKHLLKYYKAARQDYISSEEFTTTVGQHLTELKKPDVEVQTIFSVVHDVVIHLKNAASKPKKTKGVKVNSATKKDGDKIVSNGSPDTHTADGHVKTVKTEAASDSSEISGPCGIKDVNDVTLTGDVKKNLSFNNEDVSGINPTGGGKEVEGCKSGKKPSKNSDRDKASGSKDKSGDKKEDGVDKAKKHKIRRMEKLMGKLNKEIRRYSEKELSLEEMDRDDSAYLIDNKLRKRFVEAWQKCCKLKGYEAKTGRVTEKKVKFEGTRFPEINLKIRKLVKHNKFPDFQDVYHVIKKTNRVKKLGIHKFDLRPLASEVFKDVGETLSRRRLNDYMYNPGFASFINVPDDPAIENEDLKNRLQENAIKGTEMMDKVFEKYTNMAREIHAPGVEPDFDRTSEAEVAPDGSENDFEEGDWIEYVSDSDNGLAGEPLEAKIPKTEASEMETGQDKKKIHENRTGESKKHAFEDNSHSDDDISVKKKVKIEHSSIEYQETGRTSVAVHGISQSNTEVKSANTSKISTTLPRSQGIMKAETVRQGVSLKPSSETNQVKVPSQCKLTPCSVSLPKRKSLPICLTNSKPVPVPQQRRLQTISIPSGTTSLACGPVSNISKKKFGELSAKMLMEPVKLVKGGTLPQRTQTNVGSSSTGSLPVKAASHRVPLQLNLPSSATTPTSTIRNRPPHRIQLNSLPSTSSISSAKSDVPSQRIHLKLTSTKPVTVPVQVPSSRAHTNGNVLKMTRIAIPNRRANAATSATSVRQAIASPRYKNLVEKTNSEQSNGPKESYQEDDDGVIVLD